MIWSELTPDLLHTISKKLEDISDFVRFRAVCKGWRIAVSSSDPPPQLPWLLMGPFHGKERTLQLHSITSGKTLTIPLPEGDEFITGFSHGYMLFKGCGGTSFLFNPLSKRKLPLLHDLKCCRGWHVLDSLNYTLRCCSCGFCQPYVHDWVMVEESELGVTWFIQRDTKYFLMKINATTGMILSKIPIPPEPTSYDGDTTCAITESFGDVLRVTFKHDAFCVVIGIDVHRLDQGNEGPHFVRTHDIGDRVLFFDSHNLKCFSVRSDDIPGCKRNCIYFRNYGRNDGENDCLEFPYELCRYDLEEDSIEILPFHTKQSYTWLMPSLC